MTLPSAAERMSVARLMDDASAASGLSDWGDQSFSATLELLVESCRATAELTPEGWEVLRKVAVRHLRNQLYLQDFLRAHPATPSLPLTAPVVITGLPRTGTTLLHNLLALDPENRVLRFWEGLHPVPPGPDGEGVEAMVGQAERWLERLYALTPAFRAIHHSTARGPEECDALLQNTFASQHFDDMFRAEAYSQWLNHSDLAEEYGYFKLQLQTLATTDERPRQWVLKSPGHLGYLDTVLGTFPGAVVVHCHRRPDEAVSSYASLVQAVRAPHTARASPGDIGRHALNRCTVALDRALRARQRHGDDRFVDVAYTTLVTDPIGAVVDLYARLGRSLDGGTAEAMRRWLADNPQAHHGRHRYTPAQFGLSAAEVSRRMAGYGERFGPQWAAPPGVLRRGGPG
jgi:hypothetical protein